MTMKAIFINAHDRMVSPVEIENDLHVMYAKIGCDIVQTVPYENEIIVCDEEARLKPWDAGFQLDDWRIVGNALVVAEDEEGYFTDTKLEAADVAQQIRFFGTEEPMPEPCFRVIVL